MTSESRYSRQELLFGEEGQRGLQALRVAVVGVGGLGSHVVQQLAYLGVLKYVLVDGDIVTPSSLNRLIGAVARDADERRSKVDVAARVIRTIQPGAHVDTIASTLEEAQSREAIASADFVFGCLDGDPARLRLLELCARAQRPYLDLATDTGEDCGKPWYGGRVVFSFVGKGCLSCRDVLDQHALATSGMTPEQREQDARIYGVARPALAGAGPSVVCVNGVVASLGVTEFMVWATGLRAPHPALTYRGDLARLTVNVDPPRPDCYYCDLALDGARP